MLNKNREIEVKILLEGVDYLTTSNFLHALFKSRATQEIVGLSSDTYWKSPEGSDADFVRLRHREDGAQMTVKSTDMQSNLNRLEIDVNIPNHSQAIELLNTLLGQPEGVVKKDYYVAFIGEHMNITAYKVEGSNKVFIEVEANLFSRVVLLIEEILNHLPPDIKCQRVYSSLYEMFVKGQEPKVQDMSLENLINVCAS